MPEVESPDSTLAFRAPGTSAWRYLTASGPGSNEGASGVRKADEELKTLLLSSLQMQQVGVLAGSGCSLSAGGPSMQQLWLDVVGATPSEAATVVAARIRYDLGEQNIELLLSRAEAYLQVDPSDTEVSSFVTAAKQVILTSCSHFVDPSRLGAHITFLHRLSRRRVRDQRLRVFTTNYDVCFERATAELGGVALDGFSFTAPRRYDPRYFGYDIIRRPRSGDDLGHFLEGVFLLYKLHGSVNWSKEKDGTIIERESPPPTQACLIYPANGKYQQSFSQPHLESMAQYLATLSEPSTCLISVGFGLNDDHLSEPLLAAVQSNPHMRLLLVDPHADTKATSGNRFWQRFAVLNQEGEDVWLVKATFGEFAKRIPDLKSLTPADSLVRAVRGAARED